MPVTDPEGSLEGDLCLTDTAETLEGDHLAGIFIRLRADLLNDLM